MALITKGHDYQEDVIVETFNHWQNYQNICLVAPTGAGKTIIKALVAKKYIAENPDKIIVIFAHRDVLLSQISLAVAKVGLPHRLLCSKATEREIGNLHMQELKESYISDKATILVASVPTWVKRNTESLEPLIGLWLMDECHHNLRENMWGKSVEPMSSALGLGVTATPCRADGKGLGRHADGVFDVIVQTPDMGALIAKGRLSPYKVYTVPNDIDVSGVNVTSSGDYNQRKLDKATRSSHINGDAVEHYKRLTSGKQAIIFAASVAHADQVQDEFRAAGFTAIALSSKTNITERQHQVNKFKSGNTQILVNYDLFGEGFDVPAVEVVIMLRKTMSYGLFKQMFGRCLRVFEGKSYGILIDHVGNVIDHQIAGKHLHDDPEWSLDGNDKKGKTKAEDLMLNRTCPECFHYYIPKGRTIADFVCPSCSYAENQNDRTAALHDVQVRDCQLIEYDTGFLTHVFKEIEKVDTPIEVFERRLSNAPNVVRFSAVKKHKARQKKQTKLRYWIGHWCETLNKYLQVDEDAIRDEFHRTFNVDIYTAQTLSESDANQLTIKIVDSLFDFIFCKVI